MTRIWQQIFQGQIPSSHRVWWLQLCLVCFGFGLIGVTHPLWYKSAEFPQVPLFAWGCLVPGGIDVVLLGLVSVSLVAIGFTKPQTPGNRWALSLFSGAMLGLMVLDQHRIQPWAYQLVLIAVVLAAAPYQRAITLVRLLTVSIYVHSAISKFDYSFCTGLGRTFLLQLHNLLFGPLPVGAVPWETGAWPLLFPLGELVIAAGLVWPGTRRWALWCAAGMHGLLLVILGPWGLGHSWGVLVWNVYFIAQNFVLFANERTISVNPTADSTVNNLLLLRSAFATNLFVGWVVLWPCVEPWGYCDLWPAWGLYAQHGEQLTVWVSDAAIQQLPAIWRETATRNLQKDDLEWQVRPQYVSLNMTGAPLYPQNRFQLGVILAMAHRSNLEPAEVAIEWMYSADRRTGARRVTQLQNLEQIQRAADRCWLNARPRR